MTFKMTPKAAPILVGAPLPLYQDKNGVYARLNCNQYPQKLHVLKKFILQKAEKPIFKTELKLKERNVNIFNASTISATIFKLNFQVKHLHTLLPFRKHGPIVRRDNAFYESVLLFNPADVAAVFRAEPKYPKRFNLPVFEDFYSRRLKEPGVFFLNGEKWQKHKQIMSKKMMKPPEINQYIPRINEIASEMVSRIYRIRNSANDKEAFEVNELDMELFKWSFETVADFLFDRRFGSLKDSPPEKSIAFIKAIGVFLDSVLPANLFPAWLYKFYETKPFKTFDNSFAELYKFADELIDDKLIEIKRRVELGENFEDSAELIPFLLSTDRISEDEVSSSIVDTLFAGVDTTSNTMQWMLYLLAKHPDVQSRVREEVLREIPGDSEPNSYTLQRLNLVRCVIKETLRLYPVLIFTNRVLEDDMVLSGYHVPAKTEVGIMHHAIGRREDIFENASEFVPERWLRSKSNSKMDAYASIPFGHGVRMCLGRRLAELELQILLVKILKKFRLDLADNHVVEPWYRGVTIPDRPIRVKLVET